MNFRAFGMILNQAHAGHRLAYAWFIEIIYVQTSVCMFMYVCAVADLGGAEGAEAPPSHATF